MSEQITITFSNEDKKVFEDFTGLKFVEGMKLLMDNVKYGGQVGFDPFWSEENQKILREIAEDVKNGRNMHEHELIEVD